MKLTLIGNGVMAQSLARGLVKNYEIEVIGRDEIKLNAMKERIPDISVSVMKDIEDISGKNVIFCVKPYALESVSVRLNGVANAIFSILAGTKLEVLRRQIKAKHFVRTMPNIAAQNGKSMTTITGDKEIKDLATEIFGVIGRTLWVNTENQLDIATAIAGSGPAYLAIIAEALTDGGVNAGLERAHCTELVKGLFEGFYTLIEKNHPAIIKDSVMSPGGTTAAGLSVLENSNIRGSLINAINESYKRAQEIAKK